MTKSNSYKSKNIPKKGYENDNSYLADILMGEILGHPTQGKKAKPSDYKGVKKSSMLD